jgi:hypothetical protein
LLLLLLLRLLLRLLLLLLLLLPVDRSCWTMLRRAC